VSGVILFSEYNEAFGLHGPEMWATNEKTHVNFTKLMSNTEKRERVFRMRTITIKP
jgi:hypothetical protein